MSVYLRLKDDGKNVILRSINSEPYIFMRFSNSSVIDCVSHYSYNKTLTISFLSDEFYIYEDVPFEKAIEALSAESVGAWFNANIRGQYKYRRVAK